MDERPEQPPEGKLIAEALARSGISIRQAAKRAKISYGRWRQIASGYQNVSPGSFARVRAPAATLARMASVVGVTPDQLTGAGRADAAEILRTLTAEPDDEFGAMLGMPPDLSREEMRLVLAYRAGRDAERRGA